MRSTVLSFSDLRHPARSRFFVQTLSCLLLFCFPSRTAPSAHIHNLWTLGYFNRKPNCYRLWTPVSVAPCPSLVCDRSVLKVIHLPRARSHEALSIAAAVHSSYFSADSTTLLPTRTVTNRSHCFFLLSSTTKAILFLRQSCAALIRAICSRFVQLCSAPWNHNWNFSNSGICIPIVDHTPLRTGASVS